MAKTTFEDFWRELEAEVRAEGPAAIAEFRQMQDRFRIGGQISVLRKRHRLSQQQLAKRARVDQAEISRIERGVSNPTQDTLDRIAHALGAELTLLPHRAGLAASA